MTEFNHLGPRHPEYLGLCEFTGKRCYSTRREARLVAKKWKKTRGTNRLSAYLCNACGLFHLGRLRRRVRPPR